MNIIIVICSTFDDHMTFFRFSNCHRFVTCTHGAFCCCCNFHIWLKWWSSSSLNLASLKVEKPKTKIFFKKKVFNKIWKDYLFRFAICDWLINFFSFWFKQTKCNDQIKIIIIDNQHHHLHHHQRIIVVIIIDLIIILNFIILFLMKQIKNFV